MRFPGIIDWKEAPFLRLIIPFTGGILLQIQYLLTPLPAWVLAIGCMMGLALFSHTSTATLFRFRLLPGSFINLLVFSTGILLSYYRNIQHHNTWFAHYYQPGDFLVVDIDESLTKKNRSYCTSGSITYIRRNDCTIPVQGRLLIYFSKDHMPRDIDYGSRLIIVKPLEKISSAGNPFAFDYRQYCGYKGIWHQVFLREDNYLVAEKKQYNTVKKVLLDTRKKMLAILRKNIPDKKQAGLAEALLIGYKEDLEKPLLQSYINTGVVHIIAVSGMHLGLIYGMLLLLCGRLPANWRRFVSPAVIISTLWAFAFLTGASPSVLRSAIMFTCLIIGRELPYHNSTLNALAVSAFLLLWHDPSIFFDTGFQLSYAAVFSIVLFMEPVYRLCIINNKYLNEVWKLISLTIAAQILTIPITLFYFHQFPNLFLITNLVAVPLSSIILIGELVLSAVSFLPEIAQLIGWVLSKLIILLNLFVEKIGDIPCNTSNNIDFTLVQVLLLYLLITAIARWWLRTAPQSLLPALSLTWLLVLTAGILNWQASRQQAIVIYNIPQRTAVDFFAGNRFVFMGDSLLAGSSTQANFFMQPNRIARRADPSSVLPTLFQDGRLCLFGPRSMLCVDSGNASRFRKARKRPAAQYRLPIDFIVFSHNPPISVQELRGLFDCSHIILDASNSPWKTKSWVEECRQLGVDCHAVTTRGAFVFPLH